MRVKLALAGKGGGARPPPFTTVTITSKVAVYAPAEWADTLTLFHLYQYMYSVVVGRLGVSPRFFKFSLHDCYHVLKHN
jgi:hypothetical protein